jgi:uncharacterized protein YbcI
MTQTNQSLAQQIAESAAAFQERVTGRPPKSVGVVLNGDTLVITLHGALSPAEQALAKYKEGAAKVQEFHRQLFLASADTLQGDIKRITGVEVREAGAEADPASGAHAQMFTTGTMVQVFLLAGPVPTQTWNGNAKDGPK